MSIGDLLVPLLFAPERRVRRLLAFSRHARPDVRGPGAGQRPDRVDVCLERLERVLAGVARRVQRLSERAGRGRLQRLRCREDEDAAHGFELSFRVVGAHVMQCTQRSTGMMVLIMRVCRANNCTKMRGFVAVVTIKTVRPSDRPHNHNWTSTSRLKCSAAQASPIVRVGKFSRGRSLRARQRATPDAYDARATHPGPGRCGSLSARADRASRLHLDAIDAIDTQYPRT